MVAKN